MEVPRYEQFQETVPIEEYAREKTWLPGQYSEDMEVAHLNGQTYFIKDEETGQGLVMPYVLADTVGEEIGLEPGINYDSEAGKIISPEIEGAPSDEYVPGVRGFFNKVAGRPLGPEPEKLYEASALKYFIADTDVAPNIVVNEDDAEAIDFQRAGATAQHFHTGFVSDLEEVFDHLNRDFSREEFEDTLSSYAQQADLEGLENDLIEGFERHETFRSPRREEAVIDQVLENFESFR